MTIAPAIDPKAALIITATRQGALGELDNGQGLLLMLRMANAHGPTLATVGPAKNRNITRKTHETCRHT